MSGSGTVSESFDLDGQVFDVVIAAGLVVAGVILALSNIYSIFVFVGLAIAFVLHIIGMIPGTDYDGPGLLLLASYFVAVGIVIVL
ncbi:hypothetical protein [Halovivax cerinus]|uniref:Uncharacterized protein n=1 Tax=Halovivax cerinus TaxID=1487865 RepID=A0ABD5NNX7_9EURY|nr:hypothetical protein [Halovivax cerinus]